MSNSPEMKPFRQIPTWESNETFEIQGTELEALYNYFNIVAPAFTAVQQVFARGIQGGKIKVGYEYEDGTPVADDEIKAYTQKLNTYFKDKLEKEGIDPETAEVAVTQDVEASKSVILDSYGSPATQEA